MPASKTAVKTAQERLPALPLTIEGSSVLHQMMRVRWPEWRKLSSAQKQEVAKEAGAALGPMEQAGESALYSMLGHKGDLMLDRKSTRLNSSHIQKSRMPSSA